MARKHDVEIQEIEVDAQSTVWILTCKLCGKKSVPITSKWQAEQAMEEESCKADEIAEKVANRLEHTK